MADGIMDRIETINNIPLCDKEARTLLEDKAPKEHTHDEYATITEIRNVYLTPMSNTLQTLEAQYTNILTRLNNMEAKFNNIESRLDDIEARLDDLESGTIVKPTVMYTIVYGLTEGISISNTTTSINAGSRYVTTITYEEGYTYGSIRIEMGGVDITNSVTIHAPGPNQQGFAIEEVTGNLNINIMAKKVEVTVPCTSISLYTDTITMYEINGTATNIASVLPANTTDVVRWESSNPAVATVQSDRGVITAVGEGQCTVTAYCGNQQASCNVTVDVLESYNIIYYLTGVTSTNNQQTIEEGADYYSKITLTDSNYTITSAKLTINGITKNQYLTITDHVIVDIPAGIVNGDVIITVNTQEKTYPCTSLRCADEISLGMGDTQLIPLWIEPANTTDELTWRVEGNSNALYVYQNGSKVYVRAQNMIGTYTIMFTCGNYDAFCKVTIVGLECTNIQFNTPSISVGAHQGSWNCAQYLVLTPSNTTDTVEWYTDTTDYFYVTQNGTISFSKVGTYRVQARCNGLSATLTVIIN